MVTLDQVGNWSRPLLRSMESETDGTGSSTRLCIVLVISFSLGFVTALLFKLHGPITVAEFCQAVGAIGLFAGGICGSLYTINRIGNAVDNRAPGAQQ